MSGKLCRNPNGRLLQSSGEPGQPCGCAICGCGATNPAKFKLSLSGALLPLLAIVFQDAFGYLDCNRRMTLEPCLEDIDGDYILEPVENEPCRYYGLIAPCAWSSGPSTGDGPGPVMRLNYFVAAQIELYRYSEGDVWFGGFGGLPETPPPSGVYGMVQIVLGEYGDNDSTYCANCGAGGGSRGGGATNGLFYFGFIPVPDVDGEPADCGALGVVTPENRTPYTYGQSCLEYLQSIGIDPTDYVLPPGAVAGVQVTVEPVTEGDPVAFATDVSPCTDCQPEPAVERLHYKLNPCSVGGLTNLWVSYATKNANLAYTTAMYDGRCYIISEVAPTELDALPEGAIVIDALTFETCAECGCGGCDGLQVKEGATATGVFDGYIRSIFPEPGPYWNAGIQAEVPPHEPPASTALEFNLIAREGGEFVFKAGPYEVRIDCSIPKMSFACGGPVEYSTYSGSDPIGPFTAELGWFIDNIPLTLSETGITGGYATGGFGDDAFADGMPVRVVTFNFSFEIGSDQLCEG